MKDTLKYLSWVYGFWVSFFMLFRLAFLWVHREIYLPFGVGEWLSVMRHGLVMDCSMAAYFSLFPFLIFTLRTWLPGRGFVRLLKSYMAILLVSSGFGLAADLEIFRVWGHRLDAAVLPYLAYPEEALASVGSAPMGTLVSIYVLIVGLYAWLLWRYEPGQAPASWWGKLSPILATALLIIPLRGGLQQIPMNQSRVYYSHARVLNQAAENPIWDFFHSILENPERELEVLYRQVESNEARHFTQGLAQADTTFRKVVSARPNVVLVVWESLTSKVAGRWKPLVASTPNLDALSDSGIRFTNLYASGDRSEKGLAAILSGVPALGRNSIMQNPNLSEKLPFLSRDFKALGYQTMYLYGGELEFANMRTYLLHGDFDRLIGKEDFPPESYNSKWGAHDEVVFDRQIQEAAAANEPFFHTLFTLSSHEPFEVPGKPHAPGTPSDTMFCRSHRYTDACLGNWVKKASQQAWWKNTLVVVIADHGHVVPGNSRDSDREKYRIPMAWFGPALQEKGLEIDQLGSQTDLYQTLLVQISGQYKDLPFSLNLLQKQNQPHAFFSFRNGSVFLRSDRMDSIIDQKPVKSEAALYRQSVFETYYRHSNGPDKK